MIKRLLNIALLTGAAHILTIVTLKLLSQQVPVKTISTIGAIDSLIQLIISIISFGLQLSAVRHIVSSADWKSVYTQTQGARLTLSLLLMPVALLYFVDAPYYLFLLAPIFALNGDYALYGRNRPVTASLLTFIRISIPLLAIICFSIWQPGYLVPAYIISTVVVYCITNTFIARLLQAPLWPKPSYKSLWHYIESFSLGIVTVASYIIGLGLISAAAPFYEEKIIAVAYLGLKLYMVFKGVLRIINQAFVQEMLQDQIGLKVDQIAAFAGILFAACLIIFPQSLIGIFFSEAYETDYFFLVFMGLAGLMAAMFTSLTTRTLLRHRDKAYAKIAAFSALASLAVLIGLSFIQQNPINFGISLLIGELITACGLLALNKDIDLKGRFAFVLEAVLLLAVPLLLRMVSGDNYTTFVCGMLFVAIAGFIRFYKRFMAISLVKN